MVHSLWVLITLLPAARAQEEAVSGQDLADRVRILVSSLDSEEIAQRDEATVELISLGHEALPHLESYVRDAGPEVKARIGRVIDGIHGTDPLFLVRRPGRTTTLKLEGVAANELVSSSFDLYYPKPACSFLNGEYRKRRFSLSIKDATFWETVFEICEQTGLNFDPGRPPSFTSSGTGRRLWSKPSGAFALSARLVSQKSGVEIDARVHAEPGWKPISARFERWAITDDNGNDLTRDFQESDEVAEFDRFTSDTCPAAKFKGLMSNDDLDAEGKSLTFSGVLRVATVTAVQAAQWRAEEFSGPEERQLGKSTVILKEFTVKDNHVSFTITGKTLRDKQIPKDKEFRNLGWVFIADDQGRVLIHSATHGYGSSGEIGAGGSALYPSANPTRLVVVRPMEIEWVEVPFEIKRLKLPD